MNPPPPRGGRRRSDDLEEMIRRAQKRRLRVQKRRRRHASLIAAALVLIVIGILAAGFGGAAAFESSCKLSDLRPVYTGPQGGPANSFVYAADGSLLGAIPAEKNRQPVALSQMGPWMAKATVAIETTRASSVPRSKTCARARSSRAAPRSPSSSSAISTSRVSGRSSGRSRRPVWLSSSLATGPRTGSSART